MITQLPDTGGINGYTLISKTNEIIAQVNSGGSFVTEGKIGFFSGDSITFAGGWVGDITTSLALSKGLNFAFSGARFNDVVGTAINLGDSTAIAADNTLSNQVRRMIQWVTPLGQQISWTHPVTGVVTSINTSFGTGLGHVADVPDFIHIMLGQNQGDAEILSDADFSTIIGQTYQTLDRLNQYSSIRWAIETLGIVFPDTQIFISTSIQSVNSWVNHLSKKRDYTIKMGGYMGAVIFDTLTESGIRQVFEKTATNGYYLSDGIHLNVAGRTLFGNYIARKITQQFIAR